MKKPTLKEIKETSIRDRYYPYDTWSDYIFSPMSPYLAWFFIRLNISGNGVSWISGFTTIIAGIFLASDNAELIFIGSFGYIIFYQLDYVDGAVARFNGKGSVGGQYLDFIMHVISHVAIMAGLGFGAVSYGGEFIFPLAILAIVAAALSLAKFSIAWFAIAMEQQKRKAKGLPVLSAEPDWKTYKEPHFLYELIRKSTVLVFHESFLIFTLPILASIQFFLVTDMIDFRLLLIVAGAFVYFPIVIFEIQHLINRNAVDEAYWKLFNSELTPTVPDDHFFRAREKSDETVLGE